jgi:3-mercaptopyruvate sulfurtransferase SseA
MVRNKALCSLAVAIACAAIILGCKVSPPATPYQKFTNDSEVPRISLVDAKAAYDSGDAVIVDARAEVAYKTEHIKGAINIPLGNNENFDQLPKGKKIIVYCS